MKKLVIAAFASTALMSSGAFAQATDSTSFEVKGLVVDTCLIEDVQTVNFNNIKLEDSNVPGADSLTLNNGSQTGYDGNIWVSCNYGAKITAHSQNQGLFNADGADLVSNDPNDFTDKIHYRIELTHANAPFLQLATNIAQTKSVTAGGAFHDDAKLKVYIDADGTPKRPVAGTYTDLATLTVGPV